jgi:hypothetical protein
MAAGMHGAAALREYHTVTRPLLHAVTWWALYPIDPHSAFHRNSWENRVFPMLNAQFISITMLRYGV